MHLQKYAFRKFLRTFFFNEKNFIFFNLRKKLGLIAQLQGPLTKHLLHCKIKRNKKIIKGVIVT